MTTIEPHVERLGNLALLAARAGVEAIRAATARGISAEFKSGSHDLVTAADRGSETAIIRVIVENRPDDEIVGEEGGSRSGTSGVRWLIDPLDGTANFVYGRADHAVSVGVLVDGHRAVGAIVRPADGRWAVASGPAVRFGRDRPDGSAFDEPRPTAIESGPQLSHALICFGLPYAKPARQQVLSLIGSLIPLVRGVRIVGSAAGDLLAVARGEADAFVGCGLAEWDTAAGVTIVAAAGGHVREVRRSDFAIVIAGASQVVDDLAELLTEN